MMNLRLITYKSLKQITLQVFLIALLVSMGHADFGLMLGSFKKKENALNYMVSQSESPLKWGCNVFVEEIQIPDKGEWYRVCLGPFLTKKETLRYRKNLISKGFGGRMILVRTASRADPPPLSSTAPSPEPPPKSSETEPDNVEMKGAEKEVPWVEETGENLAVTLEKATLQAFKNNWEFRVESLGPDITRTNEDVERAAFDPSIWAEGGWRRDRNKIDSVTEGPVVSTGISEFLPTGTWLDLEFGVKQEDKTIVTNPDEEYKTNLSLTVTQALLRGRGLDVNLVNLRQARIDTRASEYQLRGLAQSLLAEVENAYWEYTLAKEEVKIYEASVELGVRLIKETRERIQLGQLARTEVYFAESETAQRRQDLINAQSRRANARLTLLRLMNPSGENFWQQKLVLLTPPERVDPQLEGVDQHIKVALLMRPDLNQARLAFQKGELEVVKTKNGVLPKLDFFVSLGRTGYADSFGGSVNDFADGQGGLNVYAGLRFEFPLGNRAPKALHRKSTLALEQESRSLENMAQLVAKDVLSAYIEIARSSKQIVASSATVKYQREKLGAEIEKYRFGKSTMLNVSQTERDLVESQVQAVQSVIDYIKSLTQFYFVEGSLLVRRGISAPGREPVDVISEKK